ncbi:MAG: cation diffusion facilitator family transporter, partial [Bacteroidetes bacterium]|nr:cation diffusion facilitator family transporter [Bacteroidota bacterium]
MNHSHNHIHTNSSNIKVAFFLNLAFTIIEIFGGFLTNSVAILSDALHDLGDSISLGIAWRLENVSQRKRDEKYTYGYRRFSLLGAFINGSVL